jgi:RNA polymerase sigma factor (sigma-70 family)
MSVDFTKRIRDDPSKQRGWADWYRVMYTRVYYVAFRFARGDTETARDLVQETFARFIAYRAIRKVSNDRHAVLFLAKICRNVAINSHARNKEMISVGLDEILQLPAEPLPVRQIEMDEMIAKLEPDERRIIGWVREGDRISEIAKRLGIAYSAAGVRIFRITQKLRKASTGL